MPDHVIIEGDQPPPLEVIREKEDDDLEMQSSVMERNTEFDKTDKLGLGFTKVN